MEFGELGLDVRPATVFVFEDLIATCKNVRIDKGLIGLRRWSAAMDWWEYDIQVVDYMHSLISRYETPVEVLTWKPPGFAELIHDRLWLMDVYVRETKSSTYKFESQRLATDAGVTVVYDADPAHRFGYGFKGRQFSTKGM